MTWLVLDSNYLCFRAFFSTGQLSHEDVPTGVVFGLLRDIVYLQDLYATDRIIFCWDFGKPLRCRDYQQYKETRRERVLSEEEYILRIQLHRQIRLLRTRYLKELGYKNIFYQHGYEADDIIASVVRSIFLDECFDAKKALRQKQEVVIVSDDHDLYQLLRSRVAIYSPRLKSVITEDKLREQYGVSPTAWIDVKAIAGCSSDNIKGIKGVGEVTAAKFLGGRLKETSAAYAAIVNGNRIWKRNRSLIELPYPGTKTFKIQQDYVEPSAWRDLTSRLGMTSLRDRF